MDRILPLPDGGDNPRLVSTESSFGLKTMWLTNFLEFVRALAMLAGGVQFPWKTYRIRLREQICLSTPILASTSAVV